MRLCLNMILKNESAIIERCLRSVRPFISSYVICDTGSTDGTQEIAAAVLSGIPGRFDHVGFQNFGQARNDALDCARRSVYSKDAFLLCDADMELVGGPEIAFGDMSAKAFLIEQRSGGLSYWNTRILLADAKAQYVGATHEYLSVEGGIDRAGGVHFIDHADGANRPDKFVRDIRLLTESLHANPKDARSVYYLGQSLRDYGDLPQAASVFQRRAGMGGWDEEAWRARLEEARCCRRMGNVERFVTAALEAYDMRPTRSEPLLDLTNHYREQGLHRVAAIFMERGLAIERPPHDRLFIEDHAYTTGFAEEYSTVGYYLDAKRQEIGAKCCEMLALSRTVPEEKRKLARYNSQFYAKPLSDLAPSFVSREIDAQPPEGWHFMNPSVALWRGVTAVNLRAVNYTIRPDGSYEMPCGVIATRNFWCRLSLTKDLELDVQPEEWTCDSGPILYPLVRGMEDIRLFVVDGVLSYSATVREANENGWCTIVRGTLDSRHWTAVYPQEMPRRHEKNWMPVARTERATFVYSCDPSIVLNGVGCRERALDTEIAADSFRGGSQLVGFLGGYVAVIHEVDAMPGAGERSYQHRFVWFNRDFQLKQVSRRFFFNKRGIEFCAGLCWHPDGKRFVVSYGANRDSEAWIGMLDASEVSGLLRDVDKLIE